MPLRNRFSGSYTFQDAECWLVYVNELNLVGQTPLRGFVSLISMPAGSVSELEPLQTNGRPAAFFAGAPF
jgi:hypothetical protein